MGPQELGFSLMQEPHTSSSTFLQTPFSLSKLPYKSPLRFFTCLAYFYRFYAHLIAPIEGFTF